MKITDHTLLKYVAAVHMKPDSEICTASVLSQISSSLLTHCASQSHYSTRGLTWFLFLVHVVRELLLLILTGRYVYSKCYGQLKAYQEAIPWDFIWLTNGISSSVYKSKYVYRKFFVVLMEISEPIHVPFSKLAWHNFNMRRTIPISLTCHLLENSKS